MDDSEHDDDDLDQDKHEDDQHDEDDSDAEIEVDVLEIECSETTEINIISHRFKTNSIRNYTTSERKKWYFSDNQKKFKLFF